MNKNTLNKIIKKIKDSRSIVVASHINPDGDSIGSMLSLGLALKKMGKKVYMVCQDALPVKYLKLPGAKTVKKTVTKKCDLGIAVDCSNKEILGKSLKAIQMTDYIIEIDHHQVRRKFGDLQMVDEKASCVGELIYKILSGLNISISKNIAENILASVIVETNSFRLPNVTAYSFELCSYLIKTGVDFNKLVNIVYWSKTKNEIILTGVCLSKAKFLKGEKLIWSLIKQSDFDKIRGVDADVDAVADDMRSIRNVEIACLLREKSNNELRVSLRSKRKNVARIAEKYKGGGHFDVAGCTIKNNKKSVKKLLSELNSII